MLTRGGQNVRTGAVEVRAGEASENDKSSQPPAIQNQSAVSAALGGPSTDLTNCHSISVLLENSEPDSGSSKTVTPANEQRRQEERSNVPTVLVTSEQTTPGTPNENELSDIWITAYPYNTREFNASMNVRSQPRSFTEAAYPRVNHWSNFLADSTTERKKITEPPLSALGVNNSQPQESSASVREVQDRKPQPAEENPVWNPDGFPPGWYIPGQESASFPSLQRQFNPQSYAAAHQQPQSSESESEPQPICQLPEYAHLEPMTVNGTLHKWGEQLYIEPARRSEFITGKPTGSSRPFRNMGQSRGRGAIQGRNTASQHSNANTNTNEPSSSFGVPGAPTGARNHRATPRR